MDSTTEDRQRAHDVATAATIQNLQSQGYCDACIEIMMAKAAPMIKRFEDTIEDAIRRMNRARP